MNKIRAPSLQRLPDLREPFFINAIEEDIAAIHGEALEVLSVWQVLSAASGKRQAKCSAGWLFAFSYPLACVGVTAAE